MLTNIIWALKNQSGPGQKARFDGYGASVLIEILTFLPLILAFWRFFSTVWALERGTAASA